MVGDDGGIPPHFRYLFKHFKTVPNANPTLYADVFAPITVSDVNTYIARAKKGTAPGRTGLTIDMLNLASTEVRSDIATLLCLCHAGGKVGFSSWKRRLLNPVPKVPGDPSLEKARPIMLLEVMSKLYWDVVSRRIATVLETHHLLQPQQFGSRGGRSVLDPLLVSTLVTERQFESRRDLLDKGPTPLPTALPGLLPQGGSSSLGFPPIIDSSSI